MQTSKAMLALSIGLYAGSVVSAVLATRRLNNKPVEGNVREHAMAYAPALTLFTVATGILVITNVRDARRFDALMGAYDMTRGALKDLQKSIPEKVLVDAEARILQEKVDNEFKVPAGSELLVQPNTYCLDNTTGQSFVASVEKIHKVCQALNYQVINHMMATMDDFCDELGLQHISGGSQLGWTDGPIVFNLSTRLKDETYPVVVLSVNPLPKYMH
jgi:hypothetical protein